MPNTVAQDDFISVFTFTKDTSKPGRIIYSTKIGDIYMTRLVIEPGVTTANYYHKETSVMFFIESGSILAVFEQIHTKHKEKIHIQPGMQAIHIPPYVAHATKNIGNTDAVMILFTNRPLRSGDDYTVHLLD